MSYYIEIYHYSSIDVILGGGHSPTHKSNMTNRTSECICSFTVISVKPRPLYCSNDCASNSCQCRIPVVCSNRVRISRITMDLLTLGNETFHRDDCETGMVVVQ